MPPRLPMVLVFLACYFSVIAGGGIEALSRVIAAPAPDFIARSAGVEEMRLTVAEMIAALAAFCAAPDAALRPARTVWDRLGALFVAALAIGAAIVAPAAATVGYGVLMAIAIADAVAALLRWRRAPA